MAVDGLEFIRDFLNDFDIMIERSFWGRMLHLGLLVRLDMKRSTVGAATDESEDIKVEPFRFGDILL